MRSDTRIHVDLTHNSTVDVSWFLCSLGRLESPLRPAGSASRLQNRSLGNGGPLQNKKNYIFRWVLLVSDHLSFLRVSRLVMPTLSRWLNRWEAIRYRK